MKTLLSLLLGILIGILIGAVGTLGWVTMSGGWYEYRILQPGDDIVVLVQEQGWELTVAERPIYHFRRARFRLR